MAGSKAGSDSSGRSVDTMSTKLSIFPSRISGPDVLSIVLCFLWFYTPYSRDLYRWVGENVHGGDYDHMSQYIVTMSARMIDWIAMGFVLILYKLQLPWVEKCKVDAHRPWPWLSPSEKVREEHREQSRKAMSYTIKMHIATIVLTLLLPSVWAGGKMPDEIPEWWVVALKVMAGWLIFDAGFYWGHRIQHHRRFYKWHKQHHEYKENSILASYYVHPFDIFLNIVLPAAVPAVALNMHLYTLLMMQIPLQLSNIYQHCGYTFPGNYNLLQFIPLSTDSAGRHENHHRAFQYNYGSSWAFWDKLCGTYMSPEQFYHDC